MPDFSVNPETAGSYTFKITSYNSTGESAGVVSDPVVVASDCWPDSGDAITNPFGDPPDYTTPGDPEAMHDPKYWTDETDELMAPNIKEVPPWMMFSGNGDGDGRYVRALTSDSPDDSSAENPVVKVPIVEDGRQVFNTNPTTGQPDTSNPVYTFLYPTNAVAPLEDTDTDKGLSSGGLAGCSNDSGPAGVLTLSSALYDKNDDGSNNDETYDPSTPDQINYPTGIYFRVPCLLPGQILDSDGSDVGPGTSYPIGYDLDTAMKLFWRVKTWSLTFHTSADIDTTNIQSNPDGDDVVTHTTESGSSGGSQTYDTSYGGSFTEYDIPFNTAIGFGKWDFPSSRSGSVTYSDTPELNNTWSAPAGNMEGGVGISMGYNFKKVGDLYYPLISIFACPDTFVLCFQSGSDFTYEGGQVSHLAATINGTSIEVPYVSSQAFSDDASGESNSQTVSGSLTVSLNPEEYWSFGGEYDTSTGDPTGDDGSNVSINKNTDLVANALSGFVGQTVAVFSPMYQTVSIWLQQNLGINLAWAKNLKSPLLRATVYGGAGDVRTSGGFALNRVQRGHPAPKGSQIFNGKKCGTFYFAMANGKKIKFPQGSPNGCMGYNEEMEVLSNAGSGPIYAREINSNSYYSTYPIPSNIPRGWPHLGSGTLANSYCMQLTNVNKNKTITVQIADTGPVDRDAIDLSLGAYNALGASDRHGISAVLVPKSGSCQNAPINPRTHRAF